MVLTFNQNMQPWDCKARIDKALGSLLSNHDYSHNYSAQIQCLPTSHRIGRSIPQNRPPYHPHSNRRPHHCMNYHTTSITTDLPTLTTITSINCSPILWHPDTRQVQHSNATCYFLKLKKRSPNNKPLLCQINSHAMSVTTVLHSILTYPPTYPLFMLNKQARASGSTLLHFTPDAELTYLYFTLSAINTTILAIYSKCRAHLLTHTWDKHAKARPPRSHK